MRKGVRWAGSTLRGFSRGNWLPTTRERGQRRSAVSRSGWLLAARTVWNNEKLTLVFATTLLRPFSHAVLRVGFTELQMMKLWRGLHVCMWHSDKPLVQVNTFTWFATQPMTTLYLCAYCEPLYDILSTFKQCAVYNINVFVRHVVGAKPWVYLYDML